MKILWLCNLILPEIAEDLGLGTIPKEGWVKGLYDAIGEEVDKSNIDLDIAIAFPVSNKMLKTATNKNRGFSSGIAGSRQIQYYAFCENTSKEHIYEEYLEREMVGILDDCRPDLVHCFGTEFPHTLAMARAINNPDKLLIGMQGLCGEIAKHALAHLPESVINRRTFRDKLKRDSIFIQSEHFYMRGENERQALALAGHIAGRTEFDRAYTHECNPNAEYHHAGESLRREFYSGAWAADCSEKYRIFVSQADYPLKGFHYLLIAVGEILRDFEKQFGNQEDKANFDVQIYVAGQSIVRDECIKDKLKISSYGKYLKELISEYGLQNRVHILGRLTAEQMKEQYLLCDTFVCCSSCENSPNSLGEAMMLQVPIVTAEVGGIPSVFDIGKDGYSYSCNLDESLEKVADNLKKALLERWNGGCGAAYNSEVDKRRYNAGFHARQNHNSEQNAEEMISIYERIINK